MERLNKLLAHAGIGSRRHCEELISAGRVTVDGKTVRELGTKVTPEQRVTVDGQPIHAERFVYWLVNKPRGYLCTNHDPAGRPLAIDLVPHVSQRVYTVGRLDEASEGLLLLTNDGDLANRLMHPRFGVDKTYLVQVAGNPTREDMLQLLKGVWLSEGHVKARQVKRLKKQGASTWLRIVLSEGKNREIRRMLARLGHKVLRLKRIAIGPIEIGRLASGKSRRLTPPETASLRQATERRQPREQSHMNGFWHGSAAVLANRPLARQTYLIRLACPELARAIQPGQFLMIRPRGSTDPLLGRPFALYDTVLDDQGQPMAVDVVYLVVGKVTGILAALHAGDHVDVWGPLGNGFPELAGVNHVALVAGGIGQTPFLAYVRALLGGRGYGGLTAQARVGRVTLYYGVRTADLAAGVADFEQAGATVHLASDDGSLGYGGYVTQLLATHAPPDHLVGCGPEPLMRALAGLARAWAKPCHLSLETPMACGVGICFSCVTRVRVGDGWDYRRVCLDGPVFDAGCLAWSD